MIIFRYKKDNGAQYISHLDTLRHIGKTLSRAKISVEYSKGFNPHKEIYMSPPVFVGLVSFSEYCLVDTSESPDSFMQKFNAFSPKNIKCLKAFEVSKKHKIAGLIDSAKYNFVLDREIDIDEILNKREIFVTVRCEQKDIRKKILNLQKSANNTIIATLSFGNEVLRADIFAKYLTDNFAKVLSYEKLDAYVSGKLPEDILD